jgi:hypothetical protein
MVSTAVTQFSERHVLSVNAHDGVQLIETVRLKLVAPPQLFGR